MERTTHCLRVNGDLVWVCACCVNGTYIFLSISSFYSSYCSVVVGLSDVVSLTLSVQTITFAIHDLCLHPEYVEPLREKLVAGYDQFERTGSGLPLLDSFIKESARLTPVEARESVQRCLQVVNGHVLIYNRNRKHSALRAETIHFVGWY